MVPINHSKQSVHMIGALGDGTLYLQFHNDLSASRYVWLVEHLLRRYGTVGILADNAGALTSKGMRKFLDYMDGDLEILHLPPHTPQLNPIEVEWREIKAATADIFFYGLDKMRDAIRQMIHNGEIPIVKTFDCCWLHSSPIHLCIITGTESARTSQFFTNRYAGESTYLTQPFHGGL